MCYEPRPGRARRSGPGRWFGRGSLLLGLVCCSTGIARAEEPWSVEPEQPVLARREPSWPTPALHPVGSANPITLVAAGIVWGYQQLISPVDGATCGFAPTCSRYGMEALHRHGWALGTIMAFERIVRNHRAVATYPLIRSTGGWRLYDPVEANDYWFTGRPFPLPPAELMVP